MYRIGVLTSGQKMGEKSKNKEKEEKKKKRKKKRLRLKEEKESSEEVGGKIDLGSE